ncbi:MAG: Hint domain-containing protein [Dehalococcoidales bacterium]|nr:Hint domain-containing protein [Dehalococcoidales bacterium]
MFISVLILGTVSVLLFGSCAQQPPSLPPPPPVIYSVPELKYLLISNFGDVFYVDPDFYPVAREGQEEKNALEQFPVIRANDAEFSAILAHLSLPNKAEYTTDEQLSIYREHKKLTYAVEMAASGDVYNFILRVGETQGQRIEGTITLAGKITVLKREPSFNTRPICLARGTLIDTPGGPVPVEQLSKGMAVWTVDESGERVAAVVNETSSTPVPSLFRVVRVIMNDGRSVTASAGHLTAVGQALGNYQVGDTLDGALVVEVERLAYDSGMTYDLLPSGSTGLYWANGVLLKSTLFGLVGERSG